MLAQTSQSEGCGTHDRGLFLEKKNDEFPYPPGERGLKEPSCLRGGKEKAAYREGKIRGGSKKVKQRKRSPSEEMRRKLSFETRGKAGT